MEGTRALRLFPYLAAASAAAVAAAFASACVDQHTEEVKGRELHVQYCAACHGDTGRGDGPAASAFQPPPTDLTTLAERNGGKFDEEAIMMAIDGRRAITQHGTRDMPVWGVLFAEQHKDERFGIYGATLDARALADYLRTIQQQ